METLIVICLLTVIYLLLRDKAIFKKGSDTEMPKVKVKKPLPDIMGLPKPASRISLPGKAADSPEENPQSETDNFDPEIENDDYDTPLLQEGSGKIFGGVTNLEEEEEEWNVYREYNEEKGFAAGVTFEELGSIGKMLRQDTLELSQQQEVVEIARKIQGTELFSLLESSMENASVKIAQLIDSTLTSESYFGSSNLRNKDLDDFNIGEFV